MTKLIGVVNNVSSRYSIKQLLLMFEQIAYPGYSYEDFPMHFRLEPERYKEFRGNLDWLYAEGLLFDPFSDIEKRSKQETLKSSMQRLKDDEYFQYIMSQYISSIDQSKKAWERRHRSQQVLNELVKGIVDDKVRGTTRINIDQLDSDEKRKSVVADLERIVEGITADTELGDNCAIVAAYLLRDGKINAVPVLDNPNRLLSNSKGEKDDVLQIVLRNFPIPDDSVSFEQIIEFRSDPDTRRKLLNFRRWMSKISKETLSGFEIEEEFDHLAHEYKRYMDIHKMKTTQGTLGTIVTTSIVVLENLIKIKWGDIAKQLFEVRKRKIDLMDAEFKAPGKEVAYVVKIKEKLSRDKLFDQDGLL